MAKATKDTEDKLAVFERFGLAFEMKARQAVADCPMCGKEGHFFVDPKTGKYDCKVCMAKGNAYTFMTHHHQTLLKETKVEHYKQLSALRDNLPWQVFRDHQLAYDNVNKEWVIPTSSTGTNITNLRIYDPNSEHGVISSPGCSVTLYRGDKIAASGPIFVCEGEWDAMALDWALTKGWKAEGTYSVVGVPGALIFKEDWLNLFKGREVYLLYDNDEPGRKGLEKAFTAVSSVTKNVKRLIWPEGLPEKYDIRDFITERMRDPKKAVNDLMRMVSTASIESKIVLPKITKFSKVVENFKQVLHMEQDQIDVLAVMMAVVASTIIPDDPLWVFVEGPPSSGKTELMMAFLGMPEQVYFTSRFYAQQFVSGFSGGEDCSLVKRILGKCLFIKDYTEMHTMEKADKNKVEGVLRGGYDGRIDAPFGNTAETKTYEGYFSIIAGVTQVIHNNTNSSLGERFLKINLLSAEHDVFQHSMRALSNKDKKVEVQLNREELLRSTVAGFFRYHPFDPNKLPVTTSTQQKMLCALAYIGGIVRTHVSYTKDNVLDSRPVVELPARLAAQLTKMARCLCWVFDKKTPTDPMIMKIIYKTAVHTVKSFRMDMLNVLMKHPNGITRKDLAAKIGVSVTTIDKHIEDLCVISWVWDHKTYPVVESFSVPSSSGGGQPTILYYPSPEFMNLWKMSTLDKHEFPVLTKASRGPVMAVKQGVKKTNVTSRNAGAGFSRR